MHGARRWVRVSRVCGGVGIVDLVVLLVTHLTATVVEVEGGGGYIAMLARYGCIFGGLMS